MLDTRLGKWSFVVGCRTFQKCWTRRLGPGCPTFLKCWTRGWEIGVLSLVVQHIPVMLDTRLGKWSFVVGCRTFQKCWTRRLGPGCPTFLKCWTHGWVSGLLSMVVQQYRNDNCELNWFVSWTVHQPVSWSPQTQTRRIVLHRSTDNYLQCLMCQPSMLTEHLKSIHLSKYPCL
jgi:hypothetical protein